MTFRDGLSKGHIGDQTINHEQNQRTDGISYKIKQKTRNEKMIDL